MAHERSDHRDLAEAATAILSDTSVHTGKAYVLTGPQALDWYTVADLLTRFTGHPVQYRAIADDEYIATCRRGGMPDDQAKMLLGLFVLARQGSGSQVTTTVRQLTGRDPLTLEQFLAEPGGVRHDLDGG